MMANMNSNSPPLVEAGACVGSFQGTYLGRCDIPGYGTTGYAIEVTDAAINELIDQIQKSIDAHPNSDRIWPGFEFRKDNTVSQQLKLHIFAANKLVSLDPDTDPTFFPRWISFSVITHELSAIPQGKCDDYDFIVNITVSFK